MRALDKSEDWSRKQWELSFLLLPWWSMAAHHGNPSWLPVCSPHWALALWPWEVCLCDLWKDNLPNQAGGVLPTLVPQSLLILSGTPHIDNIIIPILQKKKISFKRTLLLKGTSSEIYWLRICLAMEETCVRSLVGELGSSMSWGSLWTTVKTPHDTMKNLMQPDT